MNEAPPAVESDVTLLFISTYTCWNCTSETPVAMIGAPAGAREMREGAEEVHDEAIILSYLFDLNYDALDILRWSGAQVRREHSHTAGENYLMNHCMHCDAKIGDHYLQQPGGPFFPITDEEFEQVVVRKYLSPLQANGSVSVGVAKHIVTRRLVT